MGGRRFGSRLATDGASRSYWLSAGRDDALLDVTLSSTTLVHTLRLTWEYPARDVRVRVRVRVSLANPNPNPLTLTLNPNPNPKP